MKLRDMQILSVGYLFFSLIPPSGRSLCLLYNATGHPCPSCGMTRSLHHIVFGDLFEAFRYHPVAFALLPTLAFFTATIFVPPAARLYNENKKLFGAAIGVGAVVILAYGTLRWLVEAGSLPAWKPYFAEFHEPAYLRGFFDWSLHWFFH